MSVALVGVPKNIGAQQQVRLDVGHGKVRAALVQLKNRQFLFRAAQPVGAGNEGGGHAGVHIGAAAVAAVGDAAAVQHILHQIGHRGFAVGAGNADDGFRPGHAAQKVLAQKNGAAAREVGPLTAHEAQGQNGELGDKEGKIKGEIAFHRQRAPIHNCGGSIVICFKKRKRLWLHYTTGRWARQPLGRCGESPFRRVFSCSPRP